MGYLLAITGGQNRFETILTILKLFSKAGPIEQLFLLLGFLLLTATGAVLVGSTLLLIGFIFPAKNDRERMIIKIGQIEIRANARGLVMAGGLIMLTAAAGFSLFGSPLGKSADIPPIHAAPAGIPPPIHAAPAGIPPIDLTKKCALGVDPLICPKN